MQVHGRCHSLCGAHPRVSAPPIGIGSRQSSEIACARGMPRALMVVLFVVYDVFVDFGHMGRNGIDALLHIGRQSP
jgi:hypothetical protein